MCAYPWGLVKVRRIDHLIKRSAFRSMLWQYQIKGPISSSAQCAVCILYTLYISVLCTSSVHLSPCSHNIKSKVPSAPKILWPAASKQSTSKRPNSHMWPNLTKLDKKNWKQIVGEQSSRVRWCHLAKVVKFDDTDSQPLLQCFFCICNCICICICICIEKEFWKSFGKLEKFDRFSISLSHTSSLVYH